jgi:hypothetical protein
MPWWIVAIVVALVILAVVLAPKPKIDNAKASPFSDFNFPRSKEGDPVPRLYGTVKVKSPNTIYAGDFKAVAIKKKQKTGLFSSKKVTIGYKYYVGMDLCVALGPDVKYRKMWLGKDLIWTGCLTDCVNTANIDLPNLYGGPDKNGGVGGTITFYCGDFDQPQDAYLASKLGADVPRYQGFAHIVFHQFYWGNSTQIQPVYVEVSHHSDSLGLANCAAAMPNGLDANPMEVLYDLHVNGWGNLGIDPAFIDEDNWREAGVILWNEGNGISMLVSNPAQGGELAKEIMAQINAMYYQDPSTGKIKIKLIRNDYVIEDLPILGPSEIAEVRNFSKILWEQTLNKVRVKYKNRANDYNDGVAPDEDFANIRYAGKIRAGDISMPLCYDTQLAATIATRELTNVSVPLYKAELISNREAVPLTPGSPFLWVWPEYAITGVVMRVRKIGLGKKDDGRITLSVVQDEFALNTVITVPDPGEHAVESFPALDVTVYFIWELPYWFEALIAAELGGSRDGYYRLASYVAPPSVSSLTYDAFLDDSLIAGDDTQVLDQSTYSFSAQLDADLDRLSGWATGVVPVVTVKLLNDASILADGSAAAVRGGAGLFILNEELLGYETFTDNGDGTFDLENVHRALLDTGYIGGLEDDVIWFLDGAQGFFDTDILPASTDVYFLDVTATDLLAEGSATKHTVLPLGRKDLPLPPDDVEVDGVRALAQVITVGTPVTITWSERNRLDATIELETDASVAPESSTLYKLEVWTVLGGLVLTVDDIPAATYAYTATNAEQGDAELRVFAKRDGAYSFSYAPYPVTIIGDSLAIDGLFVYIDTETVETS